MDSIDHSDTSDVGCLAKDLKFYLIVLNRQITDNQKFDHFWDFIISQRSLFGRWNFLRDIPKGTKGIDENLIQEPKGMHKKLKLN